ncbi:MAG: hypothetical protein H6705_10780 [Myxococcales bacterium]|nr:hypothetical protein [Myxococcales bacterium]
MSAPGRLRRVLLVEGSDDEQIVYQFCNLHGIDNRARFRVMARDGYEDLRKTLPVDLKAPGVEVVGAIVDADVEPARRWQSMRDVIERFGVTGLPDEMPPSGLIVPEAPRRPRIGLWMMPDNRGDGMIEDFLRMLAKADDGLFTRAAGAVDGIPVGERLFKPTYRSKAVLHTWLAWQAEPGQPAGRALTLRYLDAENALGDAFRAWLTALFA